MTSCWGLTVLCSGHDSLINVAQDSTYLNISHHRILAHTKLARKPTQVFHDTKGLLSSIYVCLFFFFFFFFG